MTRDTDAETDLRHSGACSCAQCRSSGSDDTVTAIKAAIKHAVDCECLYCGGNSKKIRPGKYGRLLSRDEALAFIERAIHLGKPPKKRGPAPAGTQYDAAFDRRRGIFHELVRLPQHHKSQRDDAGYMLDLVKQVVEFLHRKGMRITSGAVERAWVKVHPRQGQPERTTIWRYVKKLQK